MVAAILVPVVEPDVAEPGSTIALAKLSFAGADDVTVSVAVRVLFPKPLVVLEKVTVCGEVVAVPDVDDAVSQLGTPEIE